MQDRITSRLVLSLDISLDQVLLRIPNMLSILWKIVMQFLPFSSFAIRSMTPTTCFDTSFNLVDLASCFDTYTVPEAFYSATTYDLAQPTEQQRAEWKDLIQSLLSVDHGNCRSVSIPFSLQDNYSVKIFQSYCVLYEFTSSAGTYDKGWGFMVVPAFRAQISRHLHISAPHAQFDFGTVEQAAAVFQMTGSNSLLVAGRKRTAYREPSNCIVPTSPRQFFYMTDPAHNNLEPFFDASVSIHDWQHRIHGCPSSSCAFIQIHAKNFSTCQRDTVFMSSGLGSSERQWYTDDNDRPIKRLKHNLQLIAPTWTVSLPSDSNCVLAATKNVVGRYINNIDIAKVCSEAANSSIATGEFIHIEQGWEALSERNYGLWSHAVLMSFGIAKDIEFHV